MTDIDKRARELLAAEYRKGGANPAACDLLAGRASWPNQMALNAIIAALTPPEGYVLVPVEPTEAMTDAVESMKMPHALLRTGVRIADFHERYAAMLAARPEVP